MKIILLAIACGLGYVSHFVLKFPKDWEGVAACLGSYVVLMAIHQVIESYAEKGAFYISKSHGYEKLKAYQV